MMTPEEHYAEADRLLSELTAIAARQDAGEDLYVHPDTARNHIGRAQAHATLATVQTHPYVAVDDWEAYRAWVDAGRPNAYRVDPVQSAADRCTECRHYGYSHGPSGYCLVPECPCTSWNGQ